MGEERKVSKSLDDVIKARYSLEIGGKSVDELVVELRAKGIKVSNRALYMMEQPNFSVSGQREKVELIHVSVEGLFGDQKGHSLSKIYKKAASFGLDPCTPEIGLFLCQKLVEMGYYGWLVIAMNPIVGFVKGPGVFCIIHGDNGWWLSRKWAGPGRQWSPAHEFIFRLRK